MAELTFQQLPTGRTHGVKGVFEEILGEDGQPEKEWVLAAIVDDHLVPLQSFSVGYVAHQVGRPDTAIGKSQSAAAGTQQQPAGTEELDAANKRIAELEQQLQAAQAAPPEQAPPQA